LPEPINSLSPLALLGCKKRFSRIAFVPGFE
jgi:hypothetical protein